MKLQRKVSSGSWVDLDGDKAEKFIGYAVEADAALAPIRKREPRTAQGVLDALAAGEEVKYDTQYWYALLRDAGARRRYQPRPPDYPDGRVLACGCTVYNKAEVMNASMGSSCGDCYDRMSN